MIIYGKYGVEKFRTTVGATCGRPPIHSELKTGEHSSPLRVSSNENTRRIKPSSDEVGGTP